MSDVTNLSVNERIARAIEAEAESHGGLHGAWGPTSRGYHFGINDAYTVAARIARETPSDNWVAIDDDSPDPEWPAPESWVVAMVWDRFRHHRAMVFKADWEGHIKWLDDHGYPVSPTHWHDISEPPK